MILKKKRFLGILLSLALALVLMPALALPANADATPVASVTSGNTTTEYADFSAALTNWEDGSTLKLLDDVTTSNTISISGTKTLDLNGYGIRMTSDNRVFMVPSGADLTIINNTARDRYITLNNYRGTAVSSNGAESTPTDGTGVVKVTNGYITGANSNKYGSYGAGAGIYVSGKLQMTGGTIVGNVVKTETGRGAGIHIENNASATLGGTASIIYNCTKDWGGGINVFGTLTIRDQARIQFNKGPSGIHDQGTINLSGSPVIKDNVIINNGAGKGIHVANLINVDGELTGNEGTIEIYMIIGGYGGTQRGRFSTASNYINEGVISQFTGENGTVIMDTDSEGHYLMMEGSNVSDWRVAYDANGGTGAPDSVTVQKGNSMTISTVKPTRSGYNFLKWNTKADGTGTSYAAEASFTPSASVTLYAIWTSKATLNEAIADASNYLEKIEGYNFYKDAANDLETAINDAKAVSENGDATQEEIDSAAEAMNKSLTTAENAVVSAIIKEVKALPETITTENRAEVEAVVKAYSELTDSQKTAAGKKLSKTELEKLSGFEEELTDDQTDSEKATEVTDRIDNLPALDKITAEDGTKIAAARMAYELLTPVQQAKISKETLEKLKAAEAKLAEVMEAANAVAQLAAAKSSAIDRLNDYSEAKAKSDASNSEKTYYDGVVAAGIKAIEDAEDKDAVATALTDAKKAVDAALSKIEKDRADAAAAAAEMAAADNAVKDAKAAAEEAEKAADAAAANEYASSADKNAIDDAKAALADALKAAADLPENATAAQKKAAAKAIEDAVKELCAVTDAANVNSAAEKAAAEGEATAACRLAAAKQYALDRLEDYSEAKAKSDATATEKAAYDKVVADGFAAINAATDKESVAKALTSGKRAVDAAIVKIEKERAYAAQVAKAKAIKVKIKKAKAKKGKKATVTWKKASDITGYEVAYSTSKKFSQKKTKTVNASANSTKKTLKKLKAGKKYYVKVRTYKMINNPSTGVNEKVYGKWSKVKKFKAKK